MTSGGVEPLLVDTNILVFANVAQAPLHKVALQTLQHYDALGRELWISRQVVREYLATVTRPQRFAMPTPVAIALARVQYFLRTFRVAEDNADVTERLLDLVEHIPTGGSQVHDANIVATMQVYGVNHLLTHNTKDFERFAHLITVVPLEPTP